MKESNNPHDLQPESFTRQKLKITGDIYQFSSFYNEFFVGKRLFRNSKKAKLVYEGEQQPVKETEEEIRQRTFRRAKKKLVDYINTNVFAWFDNNGLVFPGIFLTLTFAENLTDIEIGNNEFTAFIRRLNYEITGSIKAYLKYVVVIEFQKRGAVHYHAIFFNLPFIEKKRIEEIWGNGWIKVKAIDEVKDVGFYVTKYMSKNFDDQRLKGHKCYFVSDGLIKPTIVYFEELINLVKTFLPDKAKEAEKLNVPVKYLYSMDYFRYNLKQFPEVKQEITEFLNSHQ